MSHSGTRLPRQLPLWADFVPMQFSLAVNVSGEKALAVGDARTALWHADSALRASVPAVESAQLLKVNALSALNRHSEALSQSRNLTVEGSSSHPEVLAVRAAALYAAGNMPLAERVYQEVRESVQLYIPTKFLETACPIM